MSKTVAIIQPCYIPWKGYFDIIASCDEFILFDDVQYIKRTWYSRNCIKAASGLKWLSVPVKVSGRRFQSIAETEISESWADSHFNQICSAYRGARAFKDSIEEIRELYQRAGSLGDLCSVNRLFLDFICRKLGIKTPILRASELGAEGKATDRLLDICLKRGATRYVTGPAAKVYFEEHKFQSANIAVQWVDYSGYPEYEQLHPPFVHGVTILDLLFSLGKEMSHYMKHVQRAAV